ncbi:adventurous gliding motility lipoprotein CglB [Pyxidicoccus xibeiensis]|uniref:adventurous gliding motility lipoprotein CglB n=1 Tax=Pyxidicoccus xibeiensis TaxID=2906759 RepID=UPI0020A746A2|nr:adventurous gliding motility lipoprotein CglB [Pyxidicoccus xibeiensis]MCP3135994.1 adventurous gliding motility lipoprotein CglB [Pyxidicoccus xibeiensis]
MRARLTRASTLALSVLITSCQTYDFEPVEPLAITQTTREETISARKLKPNIMMLVDVSGSMTDPVDTNDPDCLVEDRGDMVVCGTSVPCNPAVCPTRWTELQGAVPSFLSASGSHVRFGLTTYPEPRGERGIVPFCRPSTELSVRKPLPSAEDDASLLSHANDINGILQSIPNAGSGQPEGGTPTSLSLQFVGSLEALQSEDRDDYVILLTDGIPNCNPQNVNSGVNDPTLCKCTLGNTACAGAAEKLGCMDMDASVTAVRELKDKDITTIVIGFGKETGAGNGPAVLEGMARAGQFARTCAPGQTSCGPNDPCDPATNLCSRGYFQAGNQAELAQALETISSALLPGVPCLVELNPAQLPSDPKLVVVYVEEESMASGDDTWQLTDKGVLFTGATCERILRSTPDAPIAVEVRAIRQR